MDSRLTFRDKCPDVCWQKQLRDSRNDLGMPDVPHLDLKRAIVRPVSRKVAESIILRYEWLGTLPSSCRVFYGIHFGPYVSGVTCISCGGSGANLNAHKEFGLIDQRELAYLARGANVHWSPPGANSKLVAWTVRLLRRDLPGAKVLLAYSDTDAGEIGTIYQAAGWVCLGMGSATRQWVSPCGRVMDQKLAYDLKRRNGGCRADWTRHLKESGWREQASNPKWRYACILDTSDAALKARIERMRVPYPKREKQATGSHQENSGGAAPTLTLQSQ